MNHDLAIDECRRAFADKEIWWATSLVRFLDQPSNEQRVFAWIVRCTRRLLRTLGESTLNLEEQLSLVESYVKESVHVDTIQETLEQLWVQRSPHETTKTAVVQLFGALKQYREGDAHRHHACTISIVMLVGAAQNPDHAVGEVLQDFDDFLRKGTPEHVNPDLAT